MSNSDSTFAESQFREITVYGIAHPDRTMDLLSVPETFGGGHACDGCVFNHNMGNECMAKAWSWPNRDDRACASPNYIKYLLDSPKNRKVWAEAKFNAMLGAVDDWDDIPF